MDRPIAALTGSTGFLGRWLVRALDEAGFHVRALVSREPVDPPLDGAPAETVIGRLDDAAALRRLAAGAAVVVHAAGRIKAPSRAGFFEVNAEGVAAMARAAAAVAPQARFVLVSSLSAREPQLSAYAASKAAGEAAARAAAPAGGLTIVRPPAIYGPGDRETLLLFKAAERLPVLPLPGGPEARVAVIHAADAAAQISALAIRSGGGVWGLSDPRPDGYSWREIMQAAASSVGRRPNLVRLPAASVLAIGALSGVLGRLAGGEPILTLGKARELLHPDWSIACEGNRADLPACRFDLRSGLDDTVAWCRAAGWLKPAKAAIS